MTTAGLPLHAVVRVRELGPFATDRDGWRVNRRPPRVGDIGTVVDILKADGLPDAYVVESVAADGSVDWLADFTLEELEQVERAP